MEKLIIIGAGGYAKSVLDSVDYFNYEMVGFLDEYKKDKEHLGYPILANSLEELDQKEKYVYIIAIGNNAARKEWFERLQKLNLRLVNVVDRTAIVSPHADGCHLERHVNISTNSVLNGDVYVEDGAFVGSSSVTIGQLKIGAWSTVGAGAVVVRDVESNTTVAGIPAKVIGRKDSI